MHLLSLYYFTVIATSAISCQWVTFLPCVSNYVSLAHRQLDLILDVKQLSLMIRRADKLEGYTLSKLDRSTHACANDNALLSSLPRMASLL